VKLKKGGEVRDKRQNRWDGKSKGHYSEKAILGGRFEKVLLKKQEKRGESSRFS